MRVVLFGVGAQAKYVVETLKLRTSTSITGIVNIDPQPRSLAPDLGVPLLGGPELLEELASLDADGVIVCHADDDVKAQVVSRLRSAGIPLISAIHPKAVVATSASVGSGSIINAGAIIQPYAQIGDSVVVHANVVVEHDNVISSFANLAPGAKLAGWVNVGAGAKVYTGAIVGPTVNIGAGAIVGAGSVVLQDVPPGSKVVGVPARIVSRGHDR